MEKDQKKIVKGYAVRAGIDKSHDFIPIDVLRKAWKDFLRNGDRNVYMNFNKSQLPIGKLIVDQCGVDDAGLKVAVTLTAVPKGFGINGTIISAEQKGSIRQINEIKIDYISATDKPLKGNEASDKK